MPLFFRSPVHMLLIKTQINDFFINDNFHLIEFIIKTFLKKLKLRTKCKIIFNNKSNLYYKLF